MSSVKELEKQRGKAQIKHNQTMRKIRQNCAVDAPNVRVVAQLVIQMVGELDALVDSHVSMVQKMNASLEQNVHQNYINLRQDEHDEVMEVANIVLGVLDEDGGPILPEIDTEAAKEDYKVMVLTLDAQIAQLQAAVAGIITPEAFVELLGMAQQVKQTILREFRKKCSDLREMLPDEIDDLKTAHDNQFNTKIPAIEKILVDLKNKKPAENQRQQARQPEPAGGGANVQANPQQVSRSSIKMKPLDPPVFDGKAKSYARFKQRFREMIEDNFDAMVQLEYLERGLPEKVKDRMSMVQKTPEQIWAQLDEMYNDPKVLVREAVQELHGLNKDKLGDNFMSKFATTLLDTETLLDNMGSGEYLRHPREVAFLQDMLPKGEALEYVKRSKGYAGNEFMQFKTFVEERKAEMEDLRKFGTGSLDKDLDEDVKQCNYCNRKNHLEKDCRKKIRDKNGADSDNDKKGMKDFEKGC